MQSDLIRGLRGIVGSRHVLTDPAGTRRYRKGYRYGEGAAIAVVRPGSLVELWRVAKLSVAADVTLIPQAANTGLTGGSGPSGEYPGGVVIVSMLRMSGVHLIDHGRQVVCLPGATLFELEAALRPLGREPHSVIGSSCIGASVMGGICNNSGGSLVRRGPAFTQLALYAALSADGELRLINHLGIRLGNDPEAMLDRVERGDFAPEDIIHDDNRWASDRAYGDHVRAIDHPAPARFNADPRCLFEASGSAGKVILLAVRLDSFPKDETTATFYVGTNDPDQLTNIRRDILGGFRTLPVAGEYIHRNAFDLADRYGKDMVVAIEQLGTDRLPRLFAAKARADSIAVRLGAADASDRAMQAISRLLPNHLPIRMRDFRDRFEHHLILKVAGDGIEEARAYLRGCFPTPDGDAFECTAKEAAKAFLHRFAVAGAAVRYRAVHPDRVQEIIALDIALPRNTRDWFETLPTEIDRAFLHKIYYGHFFCHVLHQDYILARGHDPLAIEHALWRLLDERGAEYPAEHNVGHLYRAKPALVAHYSTLDPRNQFNPGIGQTARRRFWAE